MSSSVSQFALIPKGKDIDVLISTVLSTSPRIPFYRKYDASKRILTILDGYLRSKLINILVATIGKEKLTEDIEVNYTKPEEIDSVSKDRAFAGAVLKTFVTSIKNNLDIIKKSYGDKFKLSVFEIDEIDISRMFQAGKSLIDIANMIADKIIGYYNENVVELFNNDNPDFVTITGILASAIIDTVRNFSTSIEQ